MEATDWVHAGDLLRSDFGGPVLCALDVSGNPGRIVVMWWKDGFLLQSVFHQSVLHRATPEELSNACNKKDANPLATALDSLSEVIKGLRNTVIIVGDPKEVLNNG